MTPLIWLLYTHCGPSLYMVHTHTSASIPYSAGKLNYTYHTLASWYVMATLFWITLLPSHWTVSSRLPGCDRTGYIIHTHIGLVDMTRSLRLTRNPPCKHKHFPKWLSKPQVQFRVWFGAANMIIKEQLICPPFVITSVLVFSHCGPPAMMTDNTSTHMLQ